MLKHEEPMPFMAEGRGVTVSTKQATFRPYLVAPDNPGPAPTADPVGFMDLDEGRPARLSDLWNWLGLPIQVWIITSISTAIILTLAWWAIALWGPV